MKKNHISITN